MNMEPYPKEERSPNIVDVSIQDAAFTKRKM